MPQEERLDMLSSLGTVLINPGLKETDASG